MGIIRTTLTAGLWGVTGGVASLGAGMAYLAAGTTLVPMSKSDPWFKTKTYTKYNPKGNPALIDDCIKRVPLSKIRPDLRDNEEALTLEFCRGIWGRWGFWPQTKMQERYDAPPGSEHDAWKTSELAESKFEQGLRMVNHFEVVENKGDEITVRCGGSPMNPGLRNSDGLVSISARIDRQKQEAIFSLKSALFNSAGAFAPEAEHPIPPKITFLHGWGFQKGRELVEMLTGVQRCQLQELSAGASEAGQDAEIGIEYLSVGANRHTAVADWSQDGIVAFGSDCTVALWQPKDAAVNGIRTLLRGHTDVVKAVKFLPKAEGETESILITGGDDKCLKIWKLEPSGSASCVQTIQEHTASINCIATAHSRRRDTSRVFATGAADASIKIWRLEGGEATLLQTIKPTPKFFPLCIALSDLSAEGDGLVLAAAGTRNIVQVFVAASAAEPQFEVQATLAGHDEWVRSLDFAFEKASPTSDLILASASQDKYVRLWRFHRGTELPAAAAEGNDPTMGAFLPGKSPSNKAHRLKSGDMDFSITFEALLLGHDDWIYSAKWFSNENGTLQLLSTSADNTLAIWEADPSSGIWVTTVRLGEISREKGATTATGSTGGFWTGLWSPDGKSVVTLGRTGSWRRWEYNRDNDQWLPNIGVSGHTRSVTGISWSKNGEYLLSTSLDQTTRLHAKWTAGSSNGSWHEIARPQIHGYDINCIDSIGSSQFVSGADEKLMRVFNEPKAVAKLLNRLCGIEDSQIENLPDAANMPVLGLSNKAIEAVDDDQEVEAANPEADREALDPGSTVRKSVLEIDHPPFEDSLSRHTLWPEAEKLYGHGYELSCLATSHDGTIVASACKASSLNHAVIRLFETERWTEIRPPLAAHTLTATRLRFSPDDRYLLSVGRDRQWAVFQRDSEDRFKYQPLQSNPKGHTRMILDAAWAPASDSIVFATAGRDKQVKLWKRGSADETISLAASIPATHPVTALDFLPRKTEDGKFVLATGTEEGKVTIHTVDVETLNVISSIDLQHELSVAKAVLQLAWRPDAARNELAIAGEDSSLRVYSYSPSST
ncbi:hypothetical protein JX265_003970 [Neoarthrinium moseri]|uniref:Elongator complex protein 2 n=1 Tax=Neoarthrinium moseri TaxID=1658444 RepID=A0A9Q0ASN9_9PEZI|nr:hypothetical protein JX265_003970 [Neoarthrinium moseri]